MNTPAKEDAGTTVSSKASRSQRSEREICIPNNLLTSSCQQFQMHDYATKLHLLEPISWGEVVGAICHPEERSDEGFAVAFRSTFHRTATGLASWLCRFLPQNREKGPQILHFAQNHNRCIQCRSELDCTALGHATRRRGSRASKQRLLGSKGPRLDVGLRCFAPDFQSGRWLTQSGKCSNRARPRKRGRVLKFS